MAEQRAVQIGVKAPPFTLKAHTGEEVSLASFEGRKNVVLYFYPRDETPACSREACSFRDLADRFQELDTVILGVERTTFAIDKRGILRHVWHRVKVDRHAQEVLDLVSSELA